MGCREEARGKDLPTFLREVGESGRREIIGREQSRACNESVRWGWGGRDDRVWRLDFKRSTLKEVKRRIVSESVVRDGGKRRGIQEKG